ncbi:hypothetical protein [Ktedonobacter racemifer]|uniref:hypothetical protein n=1 Tax=Ktedonobacter racemifer TaxID=363277 RepID=UPI0012F79D5C|nr:hypothetical protein [Ktedonobacter racemifer]
MNDTNLLPEALRKQSLSEREIVLPFQETLQALEILATAGYSLQGWEGWIRYANGKYGHPLMVIGAIEFGRRPGQTWVDYVQETKNFCRQTIEKEQKHWNIQAKSQEQTLYFCLAIEAENEKSKENCP